MLLHTVSAVPDAICANPRLAEIYDDLEADRCDLDHYVAIAEEFGVRSVLDIGCGTGTLAVRLALGGLDVTAVDPAEASLIVARRKPGAKGFGGSSAMRRVCRRWPSIWS